LGPKSRKNESGLTQGPLSATSLRGPLSKSPEPLRGADALVCDRFSRGRPSRPAAEFRRAGILAGLGPLHPLPSAQPNAVSLRGGPGGPPPAEHAARLATPAPPWSAQSCVPRRQSCRWSASGLPPPLLWGTLYCGAGILACGRHYCRPLLHRPLCAPLASHYVPLHFHPADHPKPPKVISLAFTSRCNARKGCEPTPYP